jgi:putative peptidoglycan lipid II flippase
VSARGLRPKHNRTDKQRKGGFVSVPLGSTGRRIAAAAALIAVLTVVTRAAGFLRTLVFASAVGTTDLGDVYQTANLIPNIIFEIVAGGALATLVVPLLAGPVADGDRRRVAGIASALLTWTVTLLVPLAALVALFAAPIVTLLGNDASPQQVAVGARMLRVFAVQLPLYGVGIVLTGVLHAHHRFVWPVLAPLLSSVTVIGAYLTFAVVDGAGTTVADVSRAGELILSVGTTLGVAVLTLCLVFPVRPLRLAWRARFALGAEIRRRAVGLAAAAVTTVAAQQLVLGYLAYLANGGPDGTLVIFLLVQTMFLLPWAVLAVPLSTPTFPVLAEAAQAGDADRFDATLARVTRAVLLSAGLGTAALVGSAGPTGRLLSAVTATHPPAALLTGGIVAFAPGLLGFALFALLSRALYAAGETRRAALAVVGGWLITALAAFVLTVGTAEADRVVALGAANSIGTTALGVALLAVIIRRRGRAALAGFGRALLVTLAGTTVATAAGWAVSRAVTASTPGAGGAIVAGMLAGVAVAGAFLGVALALDRGDVRPVLMAVMRRIRRGVISRPTGRVDTDP